MCWPMKGESPDGMSFGERAREENSRPRLFVCGLSYYLLPNGKYQTILKGTPVGDYQKARNRRVFVLGVFKSDWFCLL